MYEILKRFKKYWKIGQAKEYLLWNIFASSMNVDIWNSMQWKNIVDRRENMEVHNLYQQMP